MTEINSYYSTENKAYKPTGAVVSGPNSIPSYHVFNDIDARNKFSKINNDIYQSVESEKSSSKKTFIKVFVCSVLAVLGFIGLKKIFK